MPLHDASVHNGTVSTVYWAVTSCVKYLIIAYRNATSSSSCKMIRLQMKNCCDNSPSFSCETRNILFVYLISNMKGTFALFVHINHTGPVSTFLLLLQLKRIEQISIGLPTEWNIKRIWAYGGQMLARFGKRCIRLHVVKDNVIKWKEKGGEKGS